MEYVNASSVQQVLDTLAQADGGAVVLAGGTDLMVDYKAGKIQPQMWIDVTRVPELCGITVEDGKLAIGAAVTLTTIAHSPLVRQYFPSLAQGCGTVGSLQIRNSATLVGNVVSAQPAGDGAMSLAPLAPTFTVLSAQGKRQLSMGEMYAGFARSTIDHSRELVTKISIPLPQPGRQPPSCGWSCGNPCPCPCSTAPPWSMWRTAWSPGPGSPWLPWASVPCGPRPPRPSWRASPSPMKT